MRKKIKTILPTLTACLLVAGLAIGSTSAYMTGSSGKVNTFTVGEVKIDQYEPGFQSNNPPLQPHQEVTKDPKVKNIGENAAIVFMEVESPVGNVNLVNSAGKMEKPAVVDLFYFKQMEDAITTHENNWDSDWKLLYEHESDEEGKASKYTFAYYKLLEVNEETSSVFDKVQLKSFLEGQISSDVAQQIIVKSYAIQATDIYSEGADLTKELSEDHLKEIYQIYLNQSSAY